MEDSNLNDMISSIISKDREAFADAFQNEIKDRLSDSIIDKNIDVATDILGYPDNTIDERVTGSGIRVGGMSELKFKFKGASDAKIFAKSVMSMGVKKNGIKVSGSSVVVSNIKDKNVVDMVRMLANEMKAVKESVISALKDAYKLNESVEYTFKDNSYIHILPENANSIIKIHDKLNADNQIEMRSILEDSAEEFYRILDFCDTKITDTKETQE
jgi:hypothetical protein